MTSDLAAASCAIALSNIQVLADIGVYHHEIGRPQPLVVHVTLWVVPPGRDSAEEAFDYAKIKSIAEGLALERIVLIETFASRVAEACLDHRLVLGVRVLVEKPQGVPGSMASASVNLNRFPPRLEREESKPADPGSTDAAANAEEPGDGHRVTAHVADTGRRHAPPKWKMAILSWMAIFPTLTIFIVGTSPLLGELPLVLRLMFNTLLIAPLMTWVIMPGMTHLFRGWLFPRSLSRGRG